MNIHVKCLTCCKPITRQALERDVLRRGWTLDVWCHGKHAILEITEMDAIRSDDGHIRLTAFPLPTRLIVDRDMGDEDPGEPWQGVTCRV